ncbi:MAG: 50S ribosomal protein L11 methyltransferase [Candidatus Zixiibacteriota bacterium]
MFDNSAEFWVEVSVEVPGSLCDAVCNFVIENLSNGIVLEDEEDSAVTTIKFYIPDNGVEQSRQQLGAYLTSLVAMDNELQTVPEIRQKKIKSAEWEDEYRKSVKVTVVGGDVAVRPPWENAPPEAKYDIIVEPKMAFGTGTHETTQGCLLAIRDNGFAGMRFLDLGCGSGILAILADKMKAGYIKAIDYDLLAVENCGENFIINKVAAPHDIVHGSIEKCEDDEPYDFVCANIIKSTILDILESLDKLTAPGGYLVLSGLLEQDEQGITDGLQSLGLTNFSIHAENEWRTFTVHKE